MGNSLPTEDGLYPDISERDYHADTMMLSSTGARKLLPPSCPAIFRHEQVNGQKPKPVYDMGKAAHKMALGIGEKIVRVDAENWKTKAAQDKRDQAWADGHVPLLASDIAAAQQMAGVVHDHPLAGPLLRLGLAEMSGFFTDPVTGVRLRFRPDYLLERNGHTVCVDYKSSTSADPAAFGKSVANYGYNIQAAFYLWGLQVLGIAGDAEFLFVVQDKNPPYLVSVCDLKPEDIARGAQLVRQAVDLYARCVERDEWPAYGDSVHRVDMPRWGVYMQEAAVNNMPSLEGVEMRGGWGA